MTEEAVKAVLRLRTLGPAGLNPPQTEVVDRLRTLTEDGDGPIANLDVGVWGASMAGTQDDRDPVRTRETVSEFERWADEHGCTLRPAFDGRSSEPADDDGRRRGRFVTPLITLAVYRGERLRAVYPHVDGDDVCTIHDGVEALESMLGGVGQPEDETDENPPVPFQ